MDSCDWLNVVPEGFVSACVCTAYTRPTLCHLHRTIDDEIPAATDLADVQACWINFANRHLYNPCL